MGREAGPGCEDLSSHWRWLIRALRWHDMGRKARRHGGRRETIPLRGNMRRVLSNKMAALNVDGRTQVTGTSCAPGRVRQSALHERCSELCSLRHQTNPPTGRAYFDSTVTPRFGGLSKEPFFPTEVSSQTQQANGSPWTVTTTSWKS